MEQLQTNMPDMYDAALYLRLSNKLPLRMQRSKRPQRILLRSSADRHIRRQKYKSKCRHQHQIHQQEQSASVFRT